MRVRKMSKKRKIDTEKVILEVHSRPLLWNKRNKLYKNREARTTAWLEISKALVSGYENLSAEQQREVDKKIHQRWRTARDMYKKDKIAERQPSSSDVKKKKKYTHYDIMTFLDSVIYIPGEDWYETSYVTMPSPASPATRSPSTLATPVPPQPAKNKEKESSQFENAILECLKSNHLELESEDLAFFLSLQPTLRRFTNYQKMMFRTKVMQIVMDMENPLAQSKLEEK